MDSLTCFRIPNPDRLIIRPGNDQIRRLVEIDAENNVGVTSESLDALAGACVPDAEGFVVGGGADVVAVGGPGEVRDPLRVADEARN